MKTHTLIVNCGSEHTPRIAALAKAYGTIKIQNILEVDMDYFDYTHCIISGAPILITETKIEPYLHKINMIIKKNIPTWGICFGHQLLALSHGAQIAAGKRISGNKVISNLEKKSILRGLESEIIVHEAHEEYVTIPEGFKLLALSESTNNESMCSSNNQIIGTQFHPELSGEVGWKMFRNFYEE